MPDYIGSASGIGQQDGDLITDLAVSLAVSRAVNLAVYGGHPVKRQAWTEVEGAVSAKARVVRLWHVV